MLSAATIAALEQRELAYILGERERTSKEVREVVLADQAASVPLGRWCMNRPGLYPGWVTERASTRRTGWLRWPMDPCPTMPMPIVAIGFPGRVTE
jgi:hypothetical protein